MFGNRKRKPTDDDDALVPHGLIWYASQPVRSDQAPAEEAKQSAEIIEITRARPAETQPTDSPELKTPLVAPPAIQEAKETASQTSTQPTGSAPNEPLPFERLFSPSQQPVAIPSPNLQPIRVAEVIEIAPSEASDPIIQRIVSRGVVLVRESSAKLRATARRVHTTLQSSWERVSRSVDLKKEFLQAKQFASKLIRNAAAVSSEYKHKAQQRLEKIKLSGIRQERQALEALKLASSQSAKRSSAYFSTRRLGIKPIRIVLTGLPLRIRILFARQISEWKMWQTGAADRRLWSSMTLAAISAIVALLIISIVPRYAAKSLPSRILTPDSTVSASTATQADLTVPIAKTSGKRALPPKIPKQPRVQKLAVAHAATPRRKVYRAAEDDYIAPDTYTYYGSKSTVSR
jgi:hypothetical protein